jgi:UDP-glucuronate 4-epimerase
MVPTVLVTGAAGFIGSAVVRELSRQGSSVVAVDALLGGLYPSDEKSERFEGLSTLPGVEVHKLDLRTDDLRVLPSSITHIINQAAMPGLGLSWQDFDLYSSCNVVALARLIDVAQDWRIEKFVQISTSSVYGSEAIGDESQALQPVSPYGVTKLAGENLALAHWRDSGFPATILRYFSVYGPGQRPDMAYRKFIDKALRHQTITVFGSGEQSRSNTFIDDVVSGTIAALDEGAPGEVFNIAGGQERTLNEALSIIESALGHSLQIERRESARGDQIRTAGDSSKAQRILGFRNTVDLAEGLSRQVEWQRRRQ